MKKAKYSHTDGWLAILSYRNTPAEGMDSSPVQRFLQRRTGTRPPATDEQLEPQLVGKRTGELLRKKQRRQERTFNRFAKDLLEIAVGEEC